jgi:hypothetical protein
MVRRGGVAGGTTSVLLTDPKRIVQRGYDRLGTRYREWVATNASDVPRAALASTFRDVFAWLGRGGRFMLSLGAGSNQGSVQEGWLGVPMFFAGHDAGTNDRLLRQAGFDLELSELREENEAEFGTVRFHWVIARKPG